VARNQKLVLEVQLKNMLGRRGERDEPAGCFEFQRLKQQ